MKTGAPERLGAFTLVEVCFAVGIFAFCMVSVLALFPIGLKAGNNAAEETHAINGATAIIADLKGTRAGFAKSTLYGLTIQIPDGASQFVETKYRNASGGLSDVFTGQRYRITVITFRAEGGTPDRVFLQVSWPAAVPPGSANGSVSVFEAFNRE